MMKVLFFALCSFLYAQVQLWRICCVKKAKHKLAIQSELVRLRSLRIELPSFFSFLFSWKTSVACAPELHEYSDTNTRFLFESSDRLLLTHRHALFRHQIWSPLRRWLFSIVVVVLHADCIHIRYSCWTCTVVVVLFFSESSIVEGKDVFCAIFALTRSLLWVQSSRTEIIVYLVMVYSM